MAVTVASFKARFKQFDISSLSDARIQLVLDEAANQVNATVWGTRRDEGILYLAAHLLETDAFGESSRLVDSAQRTTFIMHFERLQLQRTGGIRNA